VGNASARELVGAVEKMSFVSARTIMLVDPSRDVSCRAPGSGARSAGHGSGNGFGGSAPHSATDSDSDTDNVCATPMCSTRAHSAKPLLPALNLSVCLQLTCARLPVVIEFVETPQCTQSAGGITVDDVLDILCSHDGAPFCICRHEPDNTSSAATPTGPVAGSAVASPVVSSPARNSPASGMDVTPTPVLVGATAAGGAPRSPAVLVRTYTRGYGLRGESTLSW